MPSTYRSRPPTELWPLGKRDQAADATPNDDSSMISLLKGILAGTRPAGVPAGVTLGPLGLLKEVAFGPIVLGATSYPIKSTMGGLLTLDASAAVGRSMANQTIRIAAVRFVLSGTTVAGGAVSPTYFASNPTGTTFTDGAAVSLAAADRTKLITSTNISPTGSAALFDAANVYTVAYNSGAPAPFACDATGKFYMSLQTLSSTTLTGTGGVVGSVLIGYDPA